jgi:hypothetical protein
MTVSELDTRMSSRELMEWMVYYQMEPFGPAREDYRAALVSTVVANSQGNKTTTDDFIKPFQFDKPKEVVEEGQYDSKQQRMMALFKSMAGAKKNG